MTDPDLAVFITAFTRRAGAPVYSQIYNHFAAAIRRGDLPAGATLPPLLELAARLSVGGKTMQRAYADLQRDGLIVSRRGSGSVVATPADAAPTLTVEGLDQFHGALRGVLKAFTAARSEVHLVSSGPAADVVKVSAWNRHDLRDELSDVTDLLTRRFGPLTGPLWEHATVAGKAFYVPTDISPQVLYFRPDMVAAAGLPDPREGWDRAMFLDAVERLADPAVGRAGFAFGLEADELLPYIWQAGADVLTPDAGGSALGCPAALAAGRYVRELASRAAYRLIADDPLVGLPWQLFAAGKAAMFIGRLTGAGVFVNSGLMKSKADWSVAPTPSGVRRACLLSIYGFGLRRDRATAAGEAFLDVMTSCEYHKAAAHPGGTQLAFRDELRPDPHHLPTFVEALAHARDFHTNLALDAQPVAAPAILSLLHLAHRQLLFSEIPPDDVMRALSAQIDTVQSQDLATLHDADYDWQ